MDRHKKVLLAIFLFVFLFRLFFALQVESFDYDSYFNLRQISSIQNSFKPVYNDSLSYGGRSLLFFPSFHYLMALLSIVPFALKIFPNLFASSLVIIIYFISFKLTNDENISLLTSFFSGFIPVFVSSTVNSISEFTFLFPLIFLLIYFFMNISNKKIINYSIISIFVLAVFHPFVFLFIFGLFFYLLLSKIAKLNLERQELELIIFSIFLSVWVQFIVFKKAFLSHGFSMIWQNAPKEILSLYFADITIAQAILSIGFIPAICGGYIIYRYLFREKNKDVYLLIGFSLSTFLLLWFKLIQLSVGLAFLSILLTILFAQFYKLFLRYLSKTRFISFKKFVFPFFLIIFLLSSFIPSFTFAQNQINTAPKELKALEWININTNPDSTILGTLEQGHIITALADRKNVVDTYFLLTDPSQRVIDVDTIFSTNSKIVAVDLMVKYSVDYILITDDLSYLSDKDCFKLVFEDDSTKVFRLVCKVKVS